MPKQRSALKRLRQSRERRLRNSAVKSRARTAVVRARRALAEGQEAAPELVQQAVRQLDQAASKGVIHANNAARRKSRLMKKLNEAQTPPPPETEPAEAE